tara:strand:- start:20020 stop:20499 length:480 start_codon:yes stop_codon:yes gene_type:complete
MSNLLNENEKAPTFKLKRNGNDIIDTSSIKNPYIVYFYPKDDTPGCTIEAIDFSSNIEFFNKNNITVIGISKDTVEKHEKFISKHNLKIILCSDITGEVCDKFGVWVEKSMYGRKYMGIERSTFLIDSKNIIFKIWKQVKVKGHVEEVIQYSKEMFNIS